MVHIHTVESWLSASFFGKSLAFYLSITTLTFQCFQKVSGHKHPQRPYINTNIILCPEIFFTKRCDMNIYTSTRTLIRNSYEYSFNELI